MPSWCEPGSWQPKPFRFLSEEEGKKEGNQIYLAHLLQCAVAAGNQG